MRIKQLVDGGPGLAFPLGDFRNQKTYSYLTFSILPAKSAKSQKVHHLGNLYLDFQILVFVV